MGHTSVESIPNEFAKTGDNKKNFLINDLVRLQLHETGAPPWMSAGMS